MAEKIAIVGSTLDSKHGGAIVAGSPTTTWNGIPVARIGDAVVCSKHGPTTILEGSKIFKADGIAVALVGSKCACGAKIELSVSLVTATS